VNDRELQRKAQIAELLLEAGRRLGETEPLRVYDAFHALLTDIVPHDGIVVSYYDERDGMIRAEYVWVEGELVDPDRLPPLELNREGAGMQSRVIVGGEPLLVNDVAAEVQDTRGTFYDVDREGTIRKLPESGPPGTSAAMMVPVRQEGRVVGVVQLMSDHGTYTTDQLELFEALVGQLAAAVRTARLQSEQRRLEAAEAAARAVAAEREQAAHVLEVVGDGIFLVDDAGVVQLWNRAAELATGLLAQDVRGKPVADVLPGWSALADRIPISPSDVAAPSVTVPVEVEGHDLWLSVVAVRSAAGIVYAFRDVTGERRLEEEKNDFIAVVSHELRTPMAGVYGAAETLLHRDAELTPVQRRALLEMIATQAERLSQITEEVLLAGSLDRGDIRVDRQPVDVAALVNDVVDTTRARVSPSKLDLEIAGDVGAVAGDPDRIQQVLVNVLDNAVKYGAEPITIRLERSHGSVRISVADTGQGIAPADRARIFEKFYRADPQLTNAPGGTGLGLYISRELTQRMGGRIDVESAPGEGATFVIELPRAETPFMRRFARGRR